MPWINITCMWRWQHTSQKVKKNRDIIILHTCTKNYDQMMYNFSETVRDRCNCYFSFWAIFCPFTPLTAQKIKILKKWRKKSAWRYHYFTYMYQKLWPDDIRFLRYAVWQMDDLVGDLILSSMFRPCMIGHSAKSRSPVILIFQQV